MSFCPRCLLADVQPPHLETRTAIIRTKAAQFGMVLSEEVVQYIAENISGAGVQALG